MLVDFDIALVRKNLIDLSYGDREFIVDLIDSLSDNFSEFIQKFPIAIEKKEVSDARFILHKMKMTFQTCKLDEMESNARSCIKSAIAGENADKKILEQLVIASGAAQVGLKEIKSEFEVK